MKQMIEKMLWYITMCVSGFTGAYLLYSATIELIVSDSDMSSGSMGASYGLMLALKYPVLYMMIASFLLIGIIGTVCIGRKAHVDLGVAHQGKAEIVLYSALQFILIICMLDGIFNKSIKEILAMLLLSVCLYLGVVWIGNIHEVIQEMR